MKIVGISIRTKNSRAMFDLPAHWGRFQKLKDQIPGDGDTIVVYSNYESEHKGAYDYLIGKELNEGADAPEGMEVVEVAEPSQMEKQEVRGNMPMALISAWQKIWQSDLARSYETDYEVHRHADHVDIYLGLNSKSN